jgi:hypothetical protein
MARVALVSGEIRGSVGALTGQKWKSVQYVKARTAPSNPRTEKQVTHRSMFKYATQIGALLHKALYSLYQCPLKGAQTTLNYFLLINRDFINDPSRDLSKLCFTKGPLPGVQALDASALPPGASVIEKLVPPMTGNTSPRGFAASSTPQVTDPRFQPFHAFDGILEQQPLSNGTDWYAPYTPPFPRAELRIELPFASVIDHFILYGPRMTDRRDNCPGQVTFYGLSPDIPPTELYTLDIPEIPTQYSQPYTITPSIRAAFSGYSIICSYRASQTQLRIGQLEILGTVRNAIMLDITPYNYGEAKPEDSLIIGAINLTQYTYSQFVTERRIAQEGPLYIESYHQPGDTIIIFAALTDGGRKISNSAAITLIVS